MSIVGCKPSSRRARLASPTVATTSAARKTPGRPRRRSDRSCVRCQPRKSPIPSNRSASPNRRRQVRQIGEPWSRRRWRHRDRLYRHPAGRAAARDPVRPRGAGFRHRNFRRGRGPPSQSLESMRAWLGDLEQALEREERGSIYQVLRDAVPDFRKETEMV